MVTRKSMGKLRAPSLLLVFRRMSLCHLPRTSALLPRVSLRFQSRNHTDRAPVVTLRPPRSHRFQTAYLTTKTK